MQTRLDNKEFENRVYLAGSPMENQKVVKDLSIVDYMKKTASGESVVTLCSQQLFSNSIKVRVRDEKIILIISEYVDARRTSLQGQNTWEALYKHSYSRIYTIRIMLPGDNFYILRNYELSDKIFLKINLQKSIEN